LYFQGEERHGVVWVLNDVSIARKWNRQRCQQQKEEQQSSDMRAKQINVLIADELLQQLIQRYEPQTTAIDGTNHCTESTFDRKTSWILVWHKMAQSSVYNMHSLVTLLEACWFISYSRDATATAVLLSILKWNRPPLKKSTFKRAVSETGETHTDQ
jgi:hypothetical protein